MWDGRGLECLPATAGAHQAAQRQRSPIGLGAQPNGCTQSTAVSLTLIFFGREEGRGKGGARLRSGLWAAASKALSRSSPVAVSGPALPSGAATAPSPPAAPLSVPAVRGAAGLPAALRGAGGAHGASARGGGEHIWGKEGAHTGFFFWGGGGGGAGIGRGTVTLCSPPSSPKLSPGVCGGGEHTSGGGTSGGGRGRGRGGDVGRGGPGRAGRAGSSPSPRPSPPSAARRRREPGAGRGHACRSPRRRGGALGAAPWPLRTARPRATARPGGCPVSAAGPGVPRVSPLGSGEVTGHASGCVVPGRGALGRRGGGLSSNFPGCSWGGLPQREPPSLPGPGGSGAERCGAVPGGGSVRAAPLRGLCPPCPVPRLRERSLSRYLLLDGDLSPGQDATCVFAFASPRFWDEMPSLWLLCPSLPGTRSAAQSPGLRGAALPPGRASHTAARGQWVGQPHTPRSQNNDIGFKSRNGPWRIRKSAQRRVLSFLSLSPSGFTMAVISICYLPTPRLERCFSSCRAAAAPPGSSWDPEQRWDALSIATPSAWRFGHLPFPSRVAATQPRAEAVSPSWAAKERPHSPALCSATQSPASAGQGHAGVAPSAWCAQPHAVPAAAGRSVFFHRREMN